MKDQPIKARIEVLSVIEQSDAIRGSKVEHRWCFIGKLIRDEHADEGQSMQVPMRIVRENWGKRLCVATPGSILRVEGHFKKYNGGLELQIVRGEIESLATYIDGYEPTQKPHGSWSWFSPFHVA